ncbi:MAG: DUF4157 domain-containing protein [Desulfobacterales bacterium]|nr:DUF4157 domain-containing protein [Desulfobacterales bacterium]
MEIFVPKGKTNRSLSSQNHDVDSALQPIRTLHNQSVHQLQNSNDGEVQAESFTITPSYSNFNFSRVPTNSCQTKLKVGSPDDKFEQEADDIAEQVMGMPNEKEEETEDIIRPKLKPEATKTPNVDLGQGISNLKGGGKPLIADDRYFFENRFREDFSHVRVHSGEQESNLADGINAKAFTIGNDIVFGTDQYKPESHAGKKLLAHELAHVVQQNKNKEGMPDVQCYQGCTSDEDTDIDDARTRAIPRVQDALQALSILDRIRLLPTNQQQLDPDYNAYSAIDQAFTEDFIPASSRTPAAARIALRDSMISSVVTRFTNIETILSGSNFACAPQASCQGPGPDAQALAHCPGGTSSNIEVCPLFFASNQALYNDRRVVLIHEAAHIDGACLNILWGDPAYPPNNAQDNAESYAFFALRTSQVVHALQQQQRQRGGP